MTPSPDLPPTPSEAPSSSRGGYLAPLLAVGLLLAAGCGGGESEVADSDASQPAPAVEAPLPEGAEARSLLGEPLFPTTPSERVLEVYTTNLEAAQRAYDATPEDADSIIWYGRRLAYLQRYDEAIEVYTRGIELHPGDARLYRHRGHRYLSTRRLDEAIADFLTAVDLIEGTEDQVEPDGLPNAAGIPTSTLHFNVWYHLGLAHYLQGDFERALLAWNSCLEASRHPDSVVATTYWLNNTLLRLGIEARAEELRAAIDAEVAGGIIESTAYLDLIRLHRGEITEEELLGDTGDALQNTTLAYGVGLWHLVNGRRESAFGIFEEILQRDGWSPFGYIAAEAEIARVDGA